MFFRLYQARRLGLGDEDITGWWHMAEETPAASPLLPPPRVVNGGRRKLVSVIGVPILQSPVLLSPDSIALPSRYQCVLALRLALLHWIPRLRSHHTPSRIGPGPNQPDPWRNGNRSFFCEGRLLERTPTVDHPNAHTLMPSKLTTLGFQPRNDILVNKSILVQQHTFFILRYLEIDVPMLNATKSKWEDRVCSLVLGP